jgi:hypothetical protein
MKRTKRQNRKIDIYARCQKLAEEINTYQSREMVLNLKDLNNNKKCQYQCLEQGLIYLKNGGK